MKLRARRREYLLEYLRLVLPRGIISAGGLAHEWKSCGSSEAHAAVTVPSHRLSRLSCYYMLLPGTCSNGHAALAPSSMCLHGTGGCASCRDGK